MDAGIKFTAEQNAFLKDKIREGDRVLRGGAGTGKTVCAIEYAKELTNYAMVEEDDLFHSIRAVGMLTFTRALVGEIKRLWEEGENKRQNVTISNVTISNIDSFVFHQIKEILEIRNLNKRVSEDVLLQHVETAKKAVFPEGDESALAKKDATFFLEEIRWIKGNELTKVEDYYNIQRVGRGLNHRITRANRAKIWAVYCEYARLMREDNYWDFLDRQAFLLHLLETGEKKPMFRYLTVDEVQDCSRLTIRLLKKLVVPGGAILWVGDSAQKIYRNSFSWKDVGIRARGRTTVLKQNHRNTVQIHRFGEAILTKEDSSEFTEVMRPTSEGPLPVYCRVSEDRIVEYLIGLLKRVPENASCAVAFPTNEMLEHYKEILNKLQINLEDLRTKKKRNQYGRFISTFHSLKGLSLDKVILLDVDAQSFPYANSEEERSRDRKLLHTAVTRARREVYLLTNGELTPYLADIPMDILRREYALHL